MKKVGIITAALISLSVFVACQDKASQPASQPKIYTIKYQIVGTCGIVDIAYLDGQGDMRLLDDIRLPWQSVEFSREEGRLVRISGQNQNPSGWLSVIIWRNGINWKSTRNSGAYVTALAEGIL